MAYGIFDTQTKNWLGDKTGPRLYDNVNWAWFAVGRMGVHFGWKKDRLVADSYPEGQRVKMTESPSPKLIIEDSIEWFEPTYKRDCPQMS
jgi:hypothetical protein